MLAFGRAMMAQPKLLMLDEPSLGLAPLMVEEVMRSIRAFRESGVTVFLVEQNANLALRLADRAYVMETGTITMTGTGAELLADEHVRASYLGAKAAVHAAKLRRAERAQRQLCRRKDVRISCKAERAPRNGRNDHDDQSTQVHRRRNGRRGVCRPSAAVGRKSRGPVKIGAFGPMSGNAAAQGQSMREAVEMVVKLKNSAGGVLGRPIEVVIGDDAGKPEEAAVVARRFATRDQVVLAIGSVSSPASLAAAQVFREEELPQIVVSGTAQRITTQGNEWVFRSAVPDRKLVADMVDFINEKMPQAQAFRVPLRQRRFRQGRVRCVRRGEQEIRHERQRPRNGTRAATSTSRGS